MIRRDALLALSAGVLAAGCATTPRRLASGGQGGGGEEGGIGGTGIFGSVTGPAGSPAGILRVNGLEVDASRATIAGANPVLEGDTVAIDAERDGQALRARRVAVFHPLLGPVETLAGGGFAVLGTPIITAEGVTRDGTALRPGLRVAVSGLWRGDAVVATSLRLAEPGPVAVLRGQLRRHGFAWHVGATRLRFAGLPAGLPEEGFVTVTGTPAGAAEPGVLLVESLEERPLAVFSRRVAALSVEGFSARNRGAPGFHLAGFGLLLDPASPVMPPPRDRRLFLGRYDAAFLVAEAVSLPPDSSGRAMVLEGGEVAAANRRWLAGA